MDSSFTSLPNWAKIFVLSVATVVVVTVVGLLSVGALTGRAVSFWPPTLSAYVNPDVEKCKATLAELEAQLERNHALRMKQEDSLAAMKLKNITSDVVARAQGNHEIEVQFQAIDKTIADERTLKEEVGQMRNSDGACA